MEKIALNPIDIPVEYAKIDKNSNDYCFYEFLLLSFFKKGDFDYGKFKRNKNRSKLTGSFCR